MLTHGKYVVTLFNLKNLNDIVALIMEPKLSHQFEEIIVKYILNLALSYNLGSNNNNNNKSYLGYLFHLKKRQLLFSNNMDN
jgi:hypothetical protein